MVSGSAKREGSSCEAPSVGHSVGEIELGGGVEVLSARGTA